jgi:sulfur relay (sulfurtransferase) complex TusBCD TusD component (DsrE family)
MADYVLVGSHDPFESADGRRMYELAGDLVDAGDDVTVYLVQNGVLSCRASSVAAGALRALSARATVMADDFSLRERAIAPADVMGGVRVAGIDTLVDAVMHDDRKVIWF